MTIENLNQDPESLFPDTVYGREAIVYTIKRGQISGKTKLGPNGAYIKDASKSKCTEKFIPYTQIIEIQFFDKHHSGRIQ